MSQISICFFVALIYKIFHDNHDKINTHRCVIMSMYVHVNEVRVTTSQISLYTSMYHNQKMVKSYSNFQIISPIKTKNIIETDCCWLRDHCLSSIITAVCYLVVGCTSWPPGLQIGHTLMTTI